MLIKLSKGDKNWYKNDFSTQMTNSRLGGYFASNGLFCQRHVLAPSDLLPCYGNGVFSNVYILASDDTKR